MAFFAKWVEDQMGRLRYLGVRGYWLRKKPWSARDFEVGVNIKRRNVVGDCRNC